MKKSWMLQAWSAINQDYQGKNQFFVGILKVPMPFMAKANESILTHIELDFMLGSQLPWYRYYASSGSD